MRLVWAVPAERIIETGERLDIIGAGATGAVLSNFPGPIFLPIALGFATRPSESPHRARLTLEIFDQDHECVHSDATPVELEPVTPVLETDHEAQSKSHFVLEFTVKQPGIHRIVLSLDGAQVAELPFDIIHS